MTKSARDILLEAARQHVVFVEAGLTEGEAREEQSRQAFLLYLLGEMNCYMEKNRVAGCHWFYCIPDSACSGNLLPLFFCISFRDRNWLVQENGSVAPYAVVQSALNNHCLRFHFPDKHTFEAFIYENGKPVSGSRNLPLSELQTPEGIHKWVDTYIRTAFASCLEK